MKYTHTSFYNFLSNLVNILSILIASIMVSFGEKTNNYSECRNVKYTSVTLLMLSISCCDGQDSILSIHSIGKRLNSLEHTWRQRHWETRVTTQSIDIVSICLICVVSIPNGPFVSIYIIHLIWTNYLWCWNLSLALFMSS